MVRTWMGHWVKRVGLRSLSSLFHFFLDQWVFLEVCVLSACFSFIDNLDSISCALPVLFLRALLSWLSCLYVFSRFLAQPLPPRTFASKPCIHNPTLRNDCRVRRFNDATPVKYRQMINV
jgi:hypothetical protein